jgi:hypothetical protein
VSNRPEAQPDRSILNINSFCILFLRCFCILFLYQPFLHIVFALFLHIVFVSTLFVLFLRCFCILFLYQHFLHNAHIVFALFLHIVSVSTLFALFLRCFCILFLYQHFLQTGSEAQPDRSRELTESNCQNGSFEQPLETVHRTFESFEVEILQHTTSEARNTARRSSSTLAVEHTLVDGHQPNDVCIICLHSSLFPEFVIPHITWQQQTR